MDRGVEHDASVSADSVAEGMTMSAHTNNRVMFVDDEEGVRRSWNRYLSDQGFDVSTAEDGAQAIRKLRKRPVDVVVADLKMPTVNGIQLLEWIHEHEPGTRFILLTGYGNEDVERKVRELGGFEYLNKPISPEALSAVVTAAAQLELIPEADDGVLVERVAPKVEVAPSAVETEVEAAPKSALRRTVEIVVGLVAAPILGLAFVIFLPIVGFGALLWTLAQEVRDLFESDRT